MSYKFPWEEVRVYSWDELVHELHAINLVPQRNNEGGHFRSPFVFRGMADATWRLQTSLIRTNSNTQIIERPLLRNFRKYSPPTAFYRDSEWELVSVAQHNGLPTRVLDWTVSPLIACHFTTDNQIYKDVDGVIWCVDAAKVKKYLSKRLKDKLEDEKAWVFDCPMLDSLFESLEEFDNNVRSDNAFVLFEPPAIDPRITNQFGVLSMVGSSNMLQDAVLENFGDNSLVRRIIIKSSAKAQIRDMLDQNNINERMIYPGLPGLCQWLKRYYSPA